jgi:hypothetical protein
MLKISDLIESKEMDSREMTRVRGGSTLALVFEPRPSPLATIDFGTRITSKVADATQAFNFAFAQGNEGAVTNNQQIAGGNGSSWSPVSQSQFQDNFMNVSGVGNISVG